MSVSIRIFAFLTGLFISSAAFAQSCVAPGQPFECLGAACDVTSGGGGGQQHEVIEAERRLRVRAIDSDGTTEFSAAELYGWVIEPESDMFVHASADVSYSGFLTGFGGGAINFGRIEISTLIRDLDSNDIVASHLITSQTNQGVVGGGGPDAFENFFGPPAVGDVPDGAEMVLLEAGRTYGIGIGATARARGGPINNGESDYFTGNLGIVLNALRVVTRPDLTSPGFDDDDGDGLPNIWETEGITDCDGNVLLDLPGFGATPDEKDLFVEYDWQAGREPRAAAIAAVKEAFLLAPDDAGGTDTGSGIRIWIDTGSLMEDGALVGDDLGGGSEIPLADIPDPTGQFIPPFNDSDAYSRDIDGNGLRDFYEVKRENFDLIRYGVFHYGISAEDRDDDGNDYPGGQAERGGDDHIDFSLRPGVFMHEIGHNLGLRHGGGDNMNCKPNYVSIMNYSMSRGINRQSRDAQIQDTDNDGNAEAQILDFSPARTVSGRSDAPIFSDDEGLNEAELDEERELDEGDANNSTVFFDDERDARDLDLDALPDWNLDGVNSTNDVEVNLNFSEDQTGCDDDEEQAISILSGHDDWSIIQMPIILDGISEEFPDNQNGTTPAIEEPIGDDMDFREIERDLGTVDLSVVKAAVPDLVMAGQQLEYVITVTNNGPNSAREVIVEDTFPELVTPEDLPETCTYVEGMPVTCLMDVIAPGESLDLVLTGRVQPRVPCGEVDTVPLENTVTVRNGDWEDLSEADNTATATSNALCLRFEYAAKFVCGDGSESDIPAVPGLYETIVNVHNFQSREMPFFKKLALAYPPREQTAGEIYPIGIDRLGTDETLKADCDDLRDRLFDRQSPARGFFEGYLVVQTPRRLDVDSVYTAGGEAGVRSIHIEEVTERDLRTALSITKKADVLEVPLGEIGAAQIRFFLVLYTVDVFNDGGVAAEAVEITDRVSLAALGPIAGAFVVPEIPFEIPPGASRDPVTFTPVPPAAEFTVTMPEIAADSSAQIRFWAVAVTYEFSGTGGGGTAFLINRAEVSAQGPDTSGADNTVEIYTPLVP